MGAKRRLHGLAVGAGGLGQGGAEPDGGHGAMGQVVVEVAAGAPVGFEAIGDGGAHPLEAGHELHDRRAVGRAAYEGIVTGEPDFEIGDGTHGLIAEDDLAGGKEGGLEGLLHPGLVGAMVVVEGGAQGKQIVLALVVREISSEFHGLSFRVCQSLRWGNSL